MTLWLWNLAAYSAAAGRARGRGRRRRPGCCASAPRAVAALLAGAAGHRACSCPLLQPWQREPPAPCSSLDRSSFDRISRAGDLRRRAASRSRRDRRWRSSLAGIVAAAGVARRSDCSGCDRSSPRARARRRARGTRRRAAARRSASTPTLRISDDVEGPATVGVRRPVVLLPRAVLDMPAARAARHRLPRADARAAPRLAAARSPKRSWCAVLWFHPARARDRVALCLAREMVVDRDDHRASPRDRRAYAEALLAFSNPQPHLIAVTPFIGRRTLSQRIALIAQEVSMSRRRASPSLVARRRRRHRLATAAAVDRFPMSRRARGAAGQVYKPGDGVSLPWSSRRSKPEYTRGRHAGEDPGLGLAGRRRR